MATVTVTARIDANDKSEFEKFCENVGMNVSTAFNMFVKAVLREKKLPFEIAEKNNDDGFWNKKNQEVLLESLKQMENGQHSVHELVEV